MTTPTAQSLVRELAERMGEFYLSTPAGGTQLTLQDAGLANYFPADINFNQITGQGAHWWVYGASDADVANRGIERRVKSYTALSTQVQFAQAWPAVISTGHYEFHLRTKRSRKLEAINTAVRTLGFTFYRPVVDETITTVNNQWKYTLPNTTLWKTINRVYLQISTDSNLVGFPYQDVEPHDYLIYEQVDASGNTSWVLQFARLPVPNRTLRIFGEAEYADLVADTDVLPLPAKIQGRAIEWIYEFAQARLYEWEANKQPQGEVDKYLATWDKKLQVAKEELLRYSPSPRPWRVVTPGQGTGTIPAEEDAHYFGAFRMTHG